MGNNETPRYSASALAGAQSSGLIQGRPWAGRFEVCMELVNQAKKCLENGDKECVMRKIEELVKVDCHNGNAVGKEVADKVRELVHELWLASSGDNEFRCGLLKVLKGLGVSKTWVKMATNTTWRYLDKCLDKCGIDWEGRATRNEIVRQLEDLLKSRFG